MTTARDRMRTSSPFNSAARRAGCSPWLTGARAGFPMSSRRRRGCPTAALSTLYYLTCPRVAAAISKLEAAGVMRGMAARLADDALRHRYESAHRDYLARREAAARTAGVEPLPPGTASAGGMPERVKCLHALVAHELAAGGVNPFGREALDAVGEWWLAGPCVAGDT